MATVAEQTITDQGVQLVPLALVQASKTNPRKHFNKAALDELTASVAQHGILQPLLVRPRAADGYELVVGERRWRAAKAAGLKAVPALVREFSDAEALEVQVVENLQRTDLHPLEEAEGYRQLMAKAKYDVARIAERVGRSVRYVYDRVKLLSLTKEAQTIFLAGEITAGHAVLLARLAPADQKRAIGDAGEDEIGGYWDGLSPLFTRERLLFAPDDESPEGEKEPRKAISVRELQAWIDKHVKLEAAQAEPMLFPDTATVVREAAEEKEKIVRITYDEITPEEARGDGQKIILGRSWKRADGKRDSKTCGRSVLGMVVIGPGRGDAFRVCVDKKGCSVHWAAYQKAAKKREAVVTKGGKTGEDREAIRRQKEAEETALRKADEARRQKAEPLVVAAMAFALKKAPVGAGTALGKFVLEFVNEQMYHAAARQAAVKHLGPGKTAEDLVRHMGLWILLNDLSDLPWNDFAMRAKTFGVNVVKIVDAAVPVEATSSPKVQTDKSKKKRGR